MESLIYSRDAGVSEHRNMENGLQLHSSPVKLFGQAKKAIIDNFKEIAKYIDEIDLFVQEICQSGCIEGLDFGDNIKDIRENVKGIIEVLARDQMKVAFFGRTSNGKSTVINAMLRDKILPSGIGHTTNCFLLVEGGLNSQEAFLLTDDQPYEPKNIQSIKQLAHALSSEKLQSSSLIRIIWPKEKCRLLKEDVVFVDSPGIDVARDLDIGIDKFCLDADVFIFVSNAESTLMQTEKNFFHKVNKRLSKPNVFILQNRWDTSELEEDVEKVKQQHLDRSVKFLVDELGVTDSKQGYERVFFVSALEALVSRMNQDKGTPIPNGTLQEGFQARLSEFADFERKFEECISMSAVRTKFEKHTQRGKKVTGDLRSMMNTIVTLIQEQLKEKEFERQQKEKELDNTKKLLIALQNDIKNKIEALRKDVEEKLSAALEHEIGRLSDVVNKFNQTFQSDDDTLRSYTKELNEHVDRRLRGNLQERCSADLKSRFDTLQAEITDDLAPLMPEEMRQQVIIREFEIEYFLGYLSICADFHEYIISRFSSDITRLIQRFLGALSRTLWYSVSVPRPISLTFQTSQGDQSSMTHDRDTMVTRAIMLTTFDSLTSRTTLIVSMGGLVYKAVGPKVTSICLMLCIGYRVYVTWANKDMERIFKIEYVKYAGSQLHRIENQFTYNCSHQIERELTSTLDFLCHNVDIHVMALEKEIKQLDSKISQLIGVTKRAKFVSNKADWLDNELNRFTDQYLKAAAL